MKEDGFTLTEALVALALGAVVIGAVLSTVRIAAKGAERARLVAADAESFARAGAILSGDAAHAVFIGDDEGRPRFEGDASRILLPEMPRPLAPEPLPSGPLEVTYQIAPAGPDSVLTRSEGAQTVALWESPGRLEFRFLDAGGEWQRDWRDVHTLPRAFAVTDPGEGTPRLVAALPALLPMACATGPGPACPLPEEAFP